MYTRKILLTVLCCFWLCATAPAQTAQKRINPITQAMLDGYATLLEQNPNDYLTLYDRASQYYRLDDYDKALSDAKRAVNCTPTKEKDYLASEYSLLADIYIQLKQYSEAYMAVENALNLTPSSYSLLYKKGNICLHLQQYDNAKAAFTAMQRVNPRSAEAVFGLAHVAAMEHKTEEAQAYLQDAEKLDPGNYLTYCRRGDIYRLLDMPQSAAADYLSAFSLSSGSERPIRSLMELAQEDYDAVDEAIDYAISKTTNVVPLYFLLGNAALEAGRYNEAYSAYRQLMSNVPADELPSLYPALAEICLHIGDLKEADTYATKTIMSNADLRANLLKATIEQARGNFPAAKLYADAALAIDNTDHQALMCAAEIAYGMKDIAGAMSCLNEAIMNDASATDALLFRAYLQTVKAGDNQAGLADYTRVASISSTTPTCITHKAIAQVKSGMALDASLTIAPVLTAADNNAMEAYLSALYLLACHKEDEAKRMLDKAKSLGFDDQYLLQYNRHPLFDVRCINGAATNAIAK